MPIGKIRRATRSLSRYREIFSILVKYGLADWAKRVDRDFLRDIISFQSPKELVELSTEERIRRAIVELGPTFIKFGQILSVRPDIVGVPLSEELKELQSNVTPDPLELVENTIESELGGTTEELFDNFESVPVASASIGQVHMAWLKSGEKVAVKVRHSGIEKVIQTDLEILKDLAQLAEDYVEDAKYFRPKETVARFSKTLMREMDFMREARNIINLGEDLSDDVTVKIPKVFEDVTTSKVLVMEWINGVALDRLTQDMKEKIDTSDIAEKAARVFLNMMFISGFYHADPHPGNIMILGDEKKIALLDFGMVGRLSPRIREHVEDMVASVVAQDSERLARIIVKAGSLPPDLDEASLGADVTEFISFYGALPVNKIKLYEALNEMMSIIHRHHIILPSEVVLVIKTLVTLEGTNRELNPEFNMLSLVAPYQASMAFSILQPWRKLARTRRFYYELQDFVETVPSALADIIERFRRETLEIHMEHRGFEHSANRLVFGILTAAMFIGSSLVLSAGVPPLLFGLSFFGLLGYLVSLVMGIRILWAIAIHGKLD